MKNQIFPLAVLFLIFLFSCNSNKKSKEVASYKYEDGVFKPVNPQIVKVAEWVKEGIICYGVVASVDKDNNIVAGRPVRVKVVQLSDQGIKLKSLENISISAAKGCTKPGLKKGETYIETEGDIFKTKEEAIAYLKKKKLYKE